MKRIAFITYSLSGGGTERNILLLSRTLRRLGHHVDIILFKGVNDYVKEFPESRRALVLVPGDLPSVIKPFMAVAGLIRLFRLARRNRYNLIIGSPHYRPYYAAALLQQTLGITCFLTVENNIPRELENINPFMRALHRLLLPIVLQSAACVVCKSAGLKTMVSTVYRVHPSRIDVIPNGLDLEAIASSCKKLPDNTYGDLFTRDVIMSAGRLDKQKNQAGLIELFGELKKLEGTEKLSLCIFGKGPLLSSLRKRAKELGLEKDVVFAGHEKANLYRYFARANLFILASSYEGFGMVLTEAMACGTPVISTDCLYGPREIIAGETSYARPVKNLRLCAYGGLFPAGFDRQPLPALARSINRLLTDRDKLRQYRNKALERSKLYSIDKVGIAYNHLIAKI